MKKAWEIRKGDSKLSPIPNFTTGVNGILSVRSYLTQNVAAIVNFDEPENIAYLLENIIIFPF